MNRSYKLNRLVDRLSTIKGVVAIILFGSVAKGKDDKYSDLDLLILFKDRPALWRGWDRVFEETATTNLSLHAIPETIEELRESNTAFLEELAEHGKVLYPRTPFDVRITSFLHRSFSILSYNISSLSYKAKMRIVYYLYGKGGRGGILKNGGGVKLGNGCIMVPQRESRAISRFLESNGAKVSKIDVLLQTNQSGKKPRDPRSPEE